MPDVSNWAWARSGCARSTGPSGCRSIFGSLATLADRVREYRERWGISYFIVPERDMNAFAPLVARLRGQ